MADTPPKPLTVTVEAPPAEKRGPGRPKGSGTKTASAGPATDVKKALATLNSAYNLIATGLMAAGMTKTAEVWAETAADLAKTNEDALNASPKLAKMLASTGSLGGTSTFIVTHVMAATSVAVVARNELAERRAAKAGEEDNVTPFPAGA